MPLYSGRMAFAQRARLGSAPIPIDRHAADNLRFIRDTMERAGSFTAVPGWGGVVIGCTALVAGMLALRRPLSEQFSIWLVDAVLAMAIAIIAVRSKSKRLALPLGTRPARRALLSFMPPLLAGGFLTGVLYHLGLLSVMPGLWLLLYGSAVVTGGAFSVRIVPVMGLCFMVLGAISLDVPAAYGNLFLMLGFGILHIIFGGIIARRHGG
jgi:hypothetical protein